MSKINALPTKTQTYQSLHTTAQLHYSSSPRATNCSTIPSTSACNTATEGN
ncbi:MAG: hypothetical protein F6J87_05190 [Spirulina sp. SIO3F2]|nr:hypothetical protein [Spirulina sp. SIO3F2]